MKKSFFLTVIVILISGAADSQQKNDYVLLGQLYGTGQFGFPEKIEGKVKEFRQLNFFPGEENGKVVKERVLTTADRVTAPSGRDYFEEFDSYGTLIKSGTLDETGKLIEYWDVDSDSGKIKGAFYFTNDILTNEIKIKYNGDNLSEITYLNPNSHNLVRRVSIEYDANGNRTRYHYYNSRGQLTLNTEFIYNEKNLLEDVRSYSIITGKMTIMFKYGYNKKGEKITQHQENFTDGDIRDYRFEYKYDKKGNYVKMIFIKDDKPTIYRERQITYFD
jgi:hypothetical protein